MSETGFFARFTPTIGRELHALEPDFVVLPGWAHPTVWQAARWCRAHGVPYGVTFENWKPQSETSLPNRITGAIRKSVLDRGAIALPAGQRAAAYGATISHAPLRVLHANVADVDGARASSEGVARSVEPRVLYLGRLMEHKGIDIVLDMASSLAKAGIALDVAGDGPARARVEQADRDGFLEYHGTVVGAEKFALLARASMVIVPSLAEPWGVIVQEALACGTPVIASTEVGSAIEFVEPGVTGAIVSADRQSFEATIRSWTERNDPEREACVARAAMVNYGTVTAELESIVAEVCG